MTLQKKYYKYKWATISIPRFECNDCDDITTLPDHKALEYYSVVDPDLIYDKDTFVTNVPIGIGNVTDGMINDVIDALQTRLCGYKFKSYGYDEFMHGKEAAERIKDYLMEDPQYYDNIHTLGVSWEELDNCGWHFVKNMSMEACGNCKDVLKGCKCSEGQCKWMPHERCDSVAKCALKDYDRGFGEYRRCTTEVWVYGLLKKDPVKRPNCSNAGDSWKMTYSGPTTYGIKQDETKDEYTPCVCIAGYSGDNCEIKHKVNPECEEDFKGVDFLNELNDVYRVPGMFDLSNDIKQLGADIEEKLDEQTEVLVKQMLENTEKLEGKIDEQSEMLISEFSGKLENQTNTILAATNAVADQVTATHDAVLHSSAKVIDAMAEQNSKLLGEMKGMGKFLTNFMSKSRDEILYRTSIGQKQVMQFIGATALQTDRKLTALEGAIQANSYFEPIALDLPIFLEKFEYALQSAHDIDRREFSDYLRNNEHDLNKSVRALLFALKGGALSKDDSLINAKMKLMGGDACLPPYHTAIQELRRDLILLHSSITTMKLWNIEFMSKGVTLEEYDIYEEERLLLMDAVTLELEEIVEETKNSSCRAFNNSLILGGGCMANMTYAGQKVPITCDNQDLFPSFNSTSLTDIKCEAIGGGLAPEWNVPPESITCSIGCKRSGETYAPGKSVDLPAAKAGHRWVNESGGLEITKITCLGNDKWEYDGGIEEDINECAERGELCKPNGDCKDLIGDFMCDCNDGFEVKERWGEDPVCEDIDECSWGGVGNNDCLASIGKGSCKNTGELFKMQSA